ncbi:MAG: hypothetical protein MJ252_05685 [archaeon]|nr:hypothetical protein [archaeon]
MSIVCLYGNEIINMGEMFYICNQCGYIVCLKCKEEFNACPDHGDQYLDELNRTANIE